MESDIPGIVVLVRVQVSAHLDLQSIQHACVGVGGRMHVEISATGIKAN